jgi:hypothetical protein
MAGRELGRGARVGARVQEPSALLVDRLKRPRAVRPDDGRRQQLRPVGRKLARPRVRRHIVRAVRASARAQRVQVEELNPLPVEPTRRLVNDQPELVALDPNRVVVAALPLLDRPRARRVGPAASTWATSDMTSDASVGDNEPLLGAPKGVGVASTRRLGVAARVAVGVVDLVSSMTRSRPPLPMRCSPRSRTWPTLKLE